MTLNITDAERKERRLEQQRESSRRFRVRNPGYRNRYVESHKRYVRNNLHKLYARNAVRKAVQSGRLTRPTICENCEQIATVEADHADYGKRLDVTWLCKPCHYKITMERKTLML